MDAHPLAPCTSTPSKPAATAFLPAATQSATIPAISGVSSARAGPYATSLPAEKENTVKLPWIAWPEGEMGRPPLGW